jgi:hypothetical protein
MLIFGSFLCGVFCGSVLGSYIILFAYHVFVAENLKNNQMNENNNKVDEKC